MFNILDIKIYSIWEINILMNIITPVSQMENGGSQWLIDLLSGSASKYPSSLVGNKDNNNPNVSELLRLVVAHRRYYISLLNKILKESLYDSFREVKMHEREDFPEELFIL